METYTLQGIVEPGRGNGKKLGAATANLPLSLAVEQGVMPGLYMCEVVVRGARYRGLIYYGINSLTRQDCLEVHLFGYAENLYGEHIHIQTERFLRPPKLFTSPEALQAQIAEDIRLSQI